jgi:hypothetical protein
MAVLAPARLQLIAHRHDNNLYHDHAVDDPDEPYYKRAEANKSNSRIPLEYDYLRSLIVGERERRGNGGRQQRVFCVSLPSVYGDAVSGFGGGGYRSLTEPALDLEKRMAAAVAEGDENAVPDTAPSSPPELSYSKSSKSSDSSVRSDSSDDERSTTTTAEKLRSFEDVTLQDSPRESVDCNVKPENRPTLRRPQKRSPTPSSEGGRPPVPAKDYPSLRSAVNGVLRDQSLNLPYGRGMRRGFTSPSTPSFTMHGAQRIPSRSPSPGKPVQSPQTLSATSPRTSWSATSPNPNGLPRRQSWQPGRKTAKQLEDEFDDGDDDLPEEVILENVPISPLPGQISQMLRSKTPSPHRRASQAGLAPSHSSLHSAKVPKNAKRPSAPTIMPNGQYGAPRSPRHSMRPPMPHSATVSTFSPEPLGHKHRSKSWTEDLNEEARQLSAALEEYAERISSEKRRSQPNSAPGSPPRPSLQKQRAKTTIMELPQKQKGSIMIDPLPISKEKEAVLTRTRPSWLPPKDQKEEKRHVKEWEQMMAKAAELEKKRASREREMAENKEELQSNIARIWEEHVLPNWDAVIAEPRTRELWWRGVTPKDRGLVWQKALGNELGLTHTSFEAALRRADEVEEKIAEMSPEERGRSKEAAWFDAIERDVPNVFPDLDVFHLSSPVGKALADVLKAYAMYRSDVGYVYGTHLVAGVLCLHMRGPEAFVTLANMLNRPTPLAFLVHDTAAMARAYDLVLGTLKYKFSNLHAHLTSSATGLKPEEFLDPIFRCLFAYNLPPEHVSRLWDIFVFEGDKTLIRAAVAILGKLEGKLYGSREGILELVGWQNQKTWDLGIDEDFISAVRDAGKVDGKGEVKSA